MNWQQDEACPYCGRVLRTTGLHAQWCRRYMGPSPLLKARMAEMARKRMHRLSRFRRGLGPW